MRFECSLLPGAPQASSAPVNTSGAAFKPCASPATFDGLPDGPYQFLVRAQGEQVADARAFTKACEHTPLALDSFPLAALVRGF